MKFSKSGRKSLHPFFYSTKSIESISDGMSKSRLEDSETENRSLRKRTEELEKLLQAVQEENKGLTEALQAVQEGE